MKKNIFWQCCTCLTAILMLASCEDTDNGNLDGTWYMTHMDSIATNQSKNMRSARKTWSFQSRLMQVFNHNNLQQERGHVIMSHFAVKGEKLIIIDPFEYNRMHGDIALTADSLDRLRPYGINHIPDTFLIETLSKSKLQVSNNIVRISFEKY